MIDYRSIQQALSTLGFTVPQDGILGPITHDAIRKALERRLGSVFAKWPQGRRLIAFQQLMLEHAGLDPGTIDGLIGPQTRMALEKWQDKLRDVPGTPTPPSPSHPHRWPTQLEVPKFYGTIGQNQVSITPPYQIFLYDTQQKINRISVHVKVFGSVERILKRVLDHYGPNTIHDLHLDRFFGSLSVRKMRGGNSWSMHSWGIALDFDASRNQLRWGRDQAAFAKPAYEEWWRLWEEEGWISLGRERNYDWMHLQAARL